MMNWIPVARWFYGLVAAAIGGGAGAVTSAITASMLAPGQFNLQDHDAMWSMAKLVGLTFLFNGGLSALLYLKQAPLPEWTEGQPDRRAQP